MTARRKNDVEAPQQIYSTFPSSERFGRLLDDSFSIMNYSAASDNLYILKGVVDWLSPPYK